MTFHLPAIVLCAKVSVTTSFHTNGSCGPFKRGDVVQHALHGRGTIAGEWGNWKDTDPLDGKRLGVNGAGIYEVRFDESEVRSVSGSSLALIESALSVHPLAQKFPALSCEEFSALKSSIAKNGLLEPITINDRGEILDGRHRYRACVELGITPSLVLFNALQSSAPDQQLSEERFIYDVNVERRHLTAAQKAVLALQFLPFVRKEAKARQEAARLIRKKS